MMVTPGATDQTPMSAAFASIPTLLNYDTAIDWPARLEREGPFLRRALAAAPSRRVVDLGAGTGEHAQWLAALGFTVVGIEGVKERWAAAESLAVANVQHLLGDLGAVEAMVRGHFGAALCLGNTLPAVLGVEAVSRLLIGLRRRLLPGGVFVAQQLNYDALFGRHATELPPRRLPLDDGELVFRRALELRDDGMVGIHETVVYRAARRPRVGPDAEDTPVHERHLFQQGWRHQQLLTLLDVAGFRRVEVFGGSAGEPFALADSSELVLVAT